MSIPKFRTLVTLALLAGGCINENEKADPLKPFDPPQTADFDFSTAKAWFDALTAAITAEGLNAPEASRVAAYAGVALYESVVPGIPDHRSLGEQLNGLGELPEAPERQDGPVHWPSAANAALAAVLADLFAGASAPTLQSFVDLEAQLAAQFATEADAATITRSIGFGQDIAAEIIDWSAADDFALVNDCAYVVPVGDGQWEPTPPGLVTPPVEPCWGNLRPFVLLFGAECAPLSPPAFSRSAGSAFALEAQEVYDTVNALTPAQQDIALFWEDATLTSPGHWLSIAGQVLEAEGEDLDVAAEAYAKLGIGLADALISGWEVRYAINLLRPIIYARDPLGPIADPAFLSFVETPAFPEFASAQAIPAGAAAALLESVLGSTGFTDDTHAGVPLAARTFNDFDEAADEAASAGLFGGIHFRSAIERGLDQGACVARTILDNVQFQE